MTEGPSRPRGPLPTSVGSLPRLPATYERTLDDGLRGLGLALPPDARRSIDDHVRLLLAWNEAINLTAIREPAAIAVRHVLDSLAALPLLGADEAVLDLGSGGGFPGLPLAIARPASRALLVDSIRKKARFLEAAVAALGLGDRVAVASLRGEALARDPAQRERWPVVTARAVGAMTVLFELAFPLLAVGGRVVAWKKCDDIDAEVRASKRALADLGGGEIELRAANLASLPEHWFVIATKRGPTPAGYPRDRDVRKREAR